MILRRLALALCAIWAIAPAPGATPRAPDPSSAARGSDPAMELAEIAGRLREGPSGLRIDEADALIRRGLELVALAPNEATEALLRFEGARLAMSRGEHGRAIEEFDRAQELARALDDVGLEIQVLLGRSVTHELSGNAEAAIAASERCLALAEQAGDDEARIAAHISIAVTRKNRGDYEAAIAHYRDALSINDAVGDAGLHALILNNIGNVYSAAGELAHAVEFLVRARDAKVELTDPTLYHTELSLGAALLRAGRYEEALALSDSAAATAARGDDDYRVAAAGLNAGVALTMLDRPEEGAARLEAAEAWFRAHGGPRELGMALVGLGYAYEALDRTDDAQRVLDESRDIARGSGAGDVDEAALKQLGEMHAAIGGYERAYRYATERAGALVAAADARAAAALERFRAEFEANEKEHRIADLERDRATDARRLAGERRVRNVILAATLIAAMLVLLLAVLYRSRAAAHDALSRVNVEVSRQRDALQQALHEVRTLRGLLPVCSHCSNVRDESGEWQPIEQYIEHRTDARVSHGICPGCAKEHYEEFLAEERRG